MRATWHGPRGARGATRPGSPAPRCGRQGQGPRERGHHPSGSYTGIRLVGDNAERVASRPPPRERTDGQGFRVDRYGRHTVERAKANVLRRLQVGGSCTFCTAIRLPGAPVVVVLTSQVRHAERHRHDTRRNHSASPIRKNATACQDVTRRDLEMARIETRGRHPNTPAVDRDLRGCCAACRCSWRVWACLLSASPGDARPTSPAGA